MTMIAWQRSISIFSTISWLASSRVRSGPRSGGYSRAEANEKLARQKGMVASFSRALTEGLTAQQSDAEFNAALDAAIESIYQASKT